MFVAVINHPKAAQAELKEETAEIEKEKEQARLRTAEDEKLLSEWRAKRDQLRIGWLQPILAPPLLPYSL